MGGGVVMGGFGALRSTAVQSGSHPGEIAPGGGVTVTVFTNCVVTPAGTTPVIVYVTLPPATMVGVSCSGALPLGAPHELPIGFGAAAQVQVNPALCSCGGSGSSTVAGAA